MKNVCNREKCNCKMSKSSIRKYLEKSTDVYHLVDENFLMGFDVKHRNFMVKKYYEIYKLYCDNHQMKALSIDNFLLNANRRKVKIIQVFCPYCGEVRVDIKMESISKIKSLQFCSKCGKKSTSINVFLQLSSLIRMQEVHKAGYEVLARSYNQEDMKIIAYDIMQMELVELASVLEKTLRDFYMDIVHIKYRSFGIEYIDFLIQKNTNNDFMNFDKANVHYKRGIGIDLKDKISPECRSNLIDLINLRNVIVHNNGFIDEKFKNTKTFSRVEDLIEGELIFINIEQIDKYLRSVLKIIITVEKIFHDIFSAEMNKLIADHYFNNML